MTILESGFSGFLGVLITAVVSIIVLVYQLKSSQKSTNFANLLKLKEMFNSERNWNVHRYFLNESEKKPEKSELYEYLGLYELAYEMRLKKQISEYEFYNTYFYRIYEISRNEYVIEIIRNEYIYWEKLVDLIQNNNAWGYKNKRINKNQYKMIRNMYERIEILNK